jgi:hypothetical protein
VRIRPEIVEDGLTGRIVSSVHEAVQAIPELLRLNRKAIRARFEERFSSNRMASDYVKIYHTMLHRRAAFSAPAARSVAAGAQDLRDLPHQREHASRIEQAITSTGGSLHEASLTASK